MKGLCHLSLALLVLILLPTLTGCEGCGCSDKDILAELVGIKGNVERDFASSLNEWDKAGIGAQFAVGDGVRAKEKSYAVLKLSEGSFAHLKEKTQIRFLSSMPGSKAPGIDVETGEAEIVVGNSEMRLLTSMGLAILESGSRVRIQKKKDSHSFLVNIGRATFQTKGEETTVISRGEEIKIGIGAAIITRPDTEPTPKVGAVTVDVQGQGIRMRPPGGTVWTDLTPSQSKIASQTLLSLPKRTTVHLQRDKEKATLHGAGLFRIGAQGRHLVQAMKGSMSLNASDSEVTVIVPGGKIMVLGGEPGGTQASVKIGVRASVVQVKAGRVEITRPEGSATLGAGERMTIARSQKTEVTAIGPEFSSLEHADFRVPAGESFRVHTPRPPVALEFHLGDRCPNEAIVQILGKRGGGRGKGSVNLMVPRGRSRYLVRCLDEDGVIRKHVVARGNIVVIRDSGKRKLPQRAPTSSVDADGRRYKIFYQNQLPIINFRWPSAPKASSYVLHISSQGKKARTIVKKAKAAHIFTSGTLREGTYRLRFAATDGSGRISKTTTVQIRFDNVAPKASLREPQEGGFVTGQNVTVAGVAAPGWKISLNNGTISVDKHHRFNGKVLYSNGHRAIAIRLVHPKRGVHYYLRRGKQ